MEPVAGHSLSLPLPLLRRALGALVVLGLSIVANGCDSTASLHVMGPDKAAVGEPAIFYVTTDPGCGKAFGGSTDPTGDFCPPVGSLTSTVDAACDGSACTVESVELVSSNNVIVLHIVGNTAGPTVLRVRAALSDGSHLSTTFSVTFVTATGLHATCAVAQKAEGITTPYGQCGGLYPVFTSSSWVWWVAFESDSGLVTSFDTSVAVQGDAVAFDSASGVFQSGSMTGTAQVTISSRQFTKTVPVRVVSMTDVVSGEVRLVTLTDGIDQEIAQIGPAPSTLWYPTKAGLHFSGDAPGTVGIVSLLTLSDGTQAYGGAGLFASDHPEICTMDPLSASANLLQQTVVFTDCKADGSATFSATVGAATINWPVTVAPPPGH
jgi:hypothetical protein